MVHDDHNALECDSSVKINGLSIDTGHTLNIFTSEDLSQSYEFKWFANNEQTGKTLLYLIILFLFTSIFSIV